MQAKLLILLYVCTAFISPAAAWDSFDYFPPMEIIYHPVSTGNKEAQEAFNKGLTAIYAFNYDEAVRSFDRATQLDPDLAMGYWGLALALDENLDSKATPVHAELTYLLTQKASQLAQRATAKEQAYIHALTHRFSPDTALDKGKLREAYSKAMAEVVQNYPDDLDAATLYAESLMDLLYWSPWNDNGTPRDHTPKILKILESVLISDPMHLGANHYYIHSVEGSPKPEQGLMSAYRLSHMNHLEWGHLLHTPSHIFIKVGYYEEMVEANRRAVHADKVYIKHYGLEGNYPLKYLAHNLSYLTMAYLWQERYSEALSTAQELEQFLHPFASQMAYYDYDLIMPLEVYVYFDRWEEVLHLPPPDSSKPVTVTFWSFARAMAYAGLGSLENAKEEQLNFRNHKEKLLGKGKGGGFGQQFFEFADLVLAAKLARIKGNGPECLKLLEDAVKRQSDFFDFSWYHPLAQTLGAVLIDEGRFSEAEQVFRTCLAKAPRNGRTLFGLSQALKFQNKDDYSITRECKEALKYSSKELTLKDF